MEGSLSDMKNKIIEFSSDKDLRISSLMTDIRDVIDDHNRDRKFTYATIIGILELIKDELLLESRE